MLLPAGLDPALYPEDLSELQPGNGLAAAATVPSGARLVIGLDSTMACLMETIEIKGL